MIESNYNIELVCINHKDCESEECYYGVVETSQSGHLILCQSYSNAKLIRDILKHDRDGKDYLIQDKSEVDHSTFLNSNIIDYIDNKFDTDKMVISTTDDNTLLDITIKGFSNLGIRLSDIDKAFIRNMMITDKVIIKRKFLGITIWKEIINREIVKE